MDMINTNNLLDCPHLVEHVGGSSLSLSIQNGHPELLGFDDLESLAFGLVLAVKGLKLLSVAFVEPRALVGAHESPVLILLHTTHEFVTHPNGVEQVASALFLNTSVFLEVQEVKDVRVPGFKVDGKGSRALVTSLVNVASSVVVNAKHGNETV